MRQNKGFTLMELLTAICIVVVLCAAASPLYTAALLRAKISQPIAGVCGVTGTLQAWYQKNCSFEGIHTNDPTGGAIYGENEVFVGTNLVCVDGLTWEVSVLDKDNIAVHWDFAEKPECNGWYCLRCDPFEGCKVEIKMDDPADPLGFNRNIGLACLF